MRQNHLTQGKEACSRRKIMPSSGEMQKPCTCSYREPSMSAGDIWGGLREVGGPPSEHSSSGSSLTMWCHPVSSAVSYMISRVPGKCSLLPVPQRAWEKTRLLSLGSREEFPGLYIRTYSPITVPFHSLMRKPNIFQQKKKKKRKETLFSYISCGSTIVFDDEIQTTCLYTSLGLKLGPNVYMEHKI